MFTALEIPETLPSHTRTWLAYLDSAIAERVGPEMVDRIEEARSQQHRARHRIGNVPNEAYWWGLYADMLSDQQLDHAKAASARVFPPIPARRVA